MPLPSSETLTLHTPQFADHRSQDQDHICTDHKCVATRPLLAQPNWFSHVQSKERAPICIAQAASQVSYWWSRDKKRSYGLVMIAARLRAPGHKHPPRLHGHRAVLPMSLAHAPNLAWVQLTPMDQLPQKNCVFGGVGTHSSRAFMVVHVGVM